MVFLPGNIGVVKYDDLVVAMSDPFTSVARDAGGLLLVLPWSLSIGGLRVRRLRRRVVWVVCQGTRGVERCSYAGFDMSCTVSSVEDVEAPSFAVLGLVLEPVGVDLAGLDCPPEEAREKPDVVKNDAGVDEASVTDLSKVTTGRETLA